MTSVVDPDITFQPQGYPARMKVAASVLPPPVYTNGLTDTVRTLATCPGVSTSDSAESLQEIPVADTRLGNLYRQASQPDSGSTYPRTRTPRRRKYEKGSSSKQSEGQGVKQGQSHRHRRRRQDVPPLELSDSSDEEWQRQRSKMPLSHV